MPEDNGNGRQVLVAMMRRLCDFSKLHHLYQPQTQSMIECFVSGAEFITRSELQPHPAFHLLERAGEVEAEIFRVLNRAREPQEKEKLDKILRDTPCSSIH